ncbi:MAG TPA: family 16 glycosylhydrolase [Flavisolibacter sp.]|jgi:beta-glucanase (GH16 family)|nr:family 16 glycosylhydrolase [Flavisolibacter sp.]
MMKQTVSCLLAIAVFALCFLSCKKEGNNTPPAVVPTVKIESASIVRTTSAGTMHFNISLDKTTTVPISFDYSVQEGTAKAPKDFTAASGTITIPANQSNAEVAVQIKGDPSDTREDNLEFTVQLSNPKGCNLGVTSAKGTIVTENGLNFVTDNAGFSTPLDQPGYTLVWNDEFSGNTLNAATWNYEIGNGSGGWGNNELEYYTNSTKNVFVSNGNLVIEARKEAISGFQYSSARITTQNKKSFTFGRVDIRAKLPRGKGVWPALWMLGNNITTVGWPACGEIDIMELLGQEPSKSYGYLHYGASVASHASRGNSYTLNTGTFYEQFHVFSMEWKQDQIKLFVDNNLFLTVNKSDVAPAPYPFNSPFFFIFNVAVGGNWPGSPDASTTFPQRMIVDYVRVYQ